MDRMDQNTKWINGNSRWPPMLTDLSQYKHDCNSVFIVNDLNLMWYQLIVIFHMYSSTNKSGEISQSCSSIGANEGKLKNKVKKLNRKMTLGIII